MDQYPKEQVVYIGRPSPLGNSHVMTRIYTRFMALKDYRYDLASALSSAAPNPIKSELIRIKELEAEYGIVYLECWCKPLPCHGDIIKQVLDAWGPWPPPQ